MPVSLPHPRWPSLGAAAVQLAERSDVMVRFRRGALWKAQVHQVAGGRPSLQVLVIREPYGRFCKLGTPRCGCLLVSL